MSRTHNTIKSVELIHKDSHGNDVIVTGNMTDTYEVYYVASLNGRMNMEALGKAQAQVCKSSKDIEIFWKLIGMLTSSNELHINTTAIAKQWHIDRSNLAKLLSRIVESKLFIKHKAGYYMCDPFIIGAKSTTQQILEQLQMDWKILWIDSLPKDEQLLLMMEYAELDLDVRLLPTKGKSYDFIQSLLIGFKEHGKLTAKQLEKFVVTVIRHRQLLVESKFSAKVPTKYNLLKKEQMTEEQIDIFKSKNAKDRLKYWQSISTS
jgi:hypothetical protein